MNDFPFVLPNTPFSARQEHFVAYDNAGMMWYGVMNWSTGEVEWSAPEPIPVGAVIGGGEDVLSGMIIPDIVWTGQEWKATDDDNE